MEVLLEEPTSSQGPTLPLSLCVIPKRSSLTSRRALNDERFSNILVSEALRAETTSKSEKQLNLWILLHGSSVQCYKLAKTSS